MIRVGVGGWVYPEWRGGVFYPKGLRQADELAYASARFTATEINATFYRTQTPETFAARHESFADPAVAALLKDENVALVLADAEDYANFDADTAEFRYVRLQRARAEEETGYPAAELDQWAKTAKGWDKDAFVFFIAGAKERNPAAAQAFLERLK